MSKQAKNSSIDVIILIILPHSFEKFEKFSDAFQKYHDI